MGKPDRACKIFTETGNVPIGCLFECQRKESCPMGEEADRLVDAMINGTHRRDRVSRETKCKRCGSTDVRWRQQGGKWVLFSMQPGVVHRCPPPSAKDDFK